MSEEFVLPFREVLPPADIPIDSMSASQCLDVTAYAERMLSFQDARLAQALARFAELRPASRSGIELADGAAEEVSMQLGITPQSAAARILQARHLVTRLPGTLAALASGAIDHYRALAMAELTHVLSDQDALAVERRVLAMGRRSTPSKFREAVRRHAIKLAPESDVRPSDATRKRRDVTQQPCFDGMGQLGAELTSDEAQAAYQRIDHLAKGAKTPGDIRSAGQRRADVLLDLVFGEHRLNVTVNVTVPVSMVGHGTDHPVWQRLLSEPVGHVLAASDRRHASRALVDHIRIRDRTCRIPGCAVPADNSETDHTIRHTDDGETSPANTGAYCKFHNLWKERSPWTVDQPQPGTFTFTSPEGRTYTTAPDPYEA